MAHTTHKEVIRRASTFLVPRAMLPTISIHSLKRSSTDDESHELPRYLWKSVALEIDRHSDQQECLVLSRSQGDGHLSCIHASVLDKQRTGSPPHGSGCLSGRLVVP